MIDRHRLGGGQRVQSLQCRVPIRVQRSPPGQQRHSRQHSLQQANALRTN